MILIFILLCGCSNQQEYKDYDTALNSVVLNDNLEMYENQGYIEKENKRVYVFSKNQNNYEYIIRAIVIEKNDSKVNILDTTSDILLNLNNSEVAKGIIFNGSNRMLVCGNNKLDISDSDGYLVQKNKKVICKLSN